MHAQQLDSESYGGKNKIGEKNSLLEANRPLIMERRSQSLEESPKRIDVRLNQIMLYVGEPKRRPLQSLEVV